LKDRPVIKVLCSSDELELFNWSTDDCITKVPAVLLSAKQVLYFRPCQKCLMAAIKLDKENK